MILSLHGGHNASAALVRHVSGSLHYRCIEAERLDRIKCSCCCERYSGDNFNSYAKSQWIKYHKRDFEELIGHLLSESGVDEDDINTLVISQYTDVNRIPRWLFKKRIIKIQHHLAHAALSYYTSPFNDALTVVFDGSGEKYNSGFEIQTAWKCSKGSLTPILHTHKPSIYDMGVGNAYELYSYLLGYGYNGCGTTMALASFAKNKPLEIDHIFSFSKRGDIFLNKHFIDVRKHIEKISYIKNGTMAFNRDYENAMRSVSLPEGYRLREKGENSLQDDFIRMAAELQLATEHVVLKYIQYALDFYPTSNLCLSGGLFLNCKINSLLRSLEKIKDIHIPTAPNDSGLALGAALCAYFRHNPPCNVEYTPYSGSMISDPKNTNGLKIFKPGDIFEYTADAIAKGNLVAWCQGKAELGPRALGHRSLLADPRNQHVTKTINDRLKKRELFRPFAPSITEEHFFECFEGSEPLPFMLETRLIKPQWKSIIPAVCHVDGSARVHVVRKKDCILFHKLISCFYQHTGVPVLLNTSLNRNGEPIVNTSDEALTLLKQDMVDIVVINDFVYLSKNIGE